MHPALLVAVRHFLVDDAAAGGHPLHVARGDGSLVAHAVAVIHAPREDVRDRLDAAVGMPGKAGEVVLGSLVPEVIEEKEGIEALRLAETECAAELDAGPFHGRGGLDEALDWPNGHA